jgi:hypothetical protein
MTTADDAGWLLGPHGPLHRAVAVGAARCGVDISNGRRAGRLACEVHGVPICPECWPMPGAPANAQQVRARR